jgi:hypothetical protein
MIVLRNIITAIRPALQKFLPVDENLWVSPSSPLVVKGGAGIIVPSSSSVPALTLDNSPYHSALRKLHKR